ncbi:nuclease-related domain-containing protein [Cytobacillus purgationiresistens]|nr:nuclease-related domain-containing protein [Cytobacillus purgationiresistens]
MIVKPRSPAPQLTFMECLNNHLDLSLKEKQYLENLRKGEVGERAWEKQLNTLSAEVLILYDLTLEINHTLFQIDALCIFQNEIIAFEVKNYQGEFHIKNNLWYSSSLNEIKNPLLQVRRNESLLRQIAKRHKIRLPIKYPLIFVHPEFMLYEIPPNENIILIPQIRRFIETLNKKPSILNKSHHQIAEMLISMNIQRDDYSLKFNYCFEGMRKGIWCNKCNGKIVRWGKSNLFCEQCQTEESIATGVLRSIQNLKILFPSQKISTALVHEWCGELASKITIQRILKRDLNKMGGSKNIYYV